MGVNNEVSLTFCCVFFLLFLRLVSPNTAVIHLLDHEGQEMLIVQNCHLIFQSNNNNNIGDNNRMVMKIVRTVLIMIIIIVIIMRLMIMIMIITTTTINQ